MTNHMLDIINLESNSNAGDIPVQVKLSCGETNVPPGHCGTHWPCERKDPGKHPVHCS
jgi:hypothetical protein